MEKLTENMIRWAEGLARMTDTELLAIRGIGKKSLADIREALEYEDD